MVPIDTMQLLDDRPRRDSFRRMLICQVVCAIWLACGGPPKMPANGVIEADIQDWGFRRYQSVLDIEVWVPENDAVGYTASYAQKTAEKMGRLSDSDVLHVFVTRYSNDTGVVRALIKFVRRLGRQSGYKIQEREVAGLRFFEVQGANEYWVFWASKAHVIKIGAGVARQGIPEDLLQAYGERYRSLLQAGALDGPLPGTERAPEVKVDDTEELDNF